MKSKLRRLLREGLLLLVLLAGVMLVMDWWRAPQAPAAFGSQPLSTLQGQQVTLDNLSQDKPLLVYFWASWCGVCRFTTPDVAKLAQQGENVLSIALQSGSGQDVERYLSKKGLSFPVVNDANGALSRSWQISATPTVMVIYKGKVVSTTSGWTSYWGMKLRMWWASVA